MIVVRVELWRKGDPNDVETLGTAVIGNDLSGTLYRGNYNVYLGRFHEIATNKVMKRPWQTGRVEDFPRRSLGPWDLLYRALKETVGGRNA